MSTPNEALEALEHQLTVARDYLSEKEVAERLAVYLRRDAERNVKDLERRIQLTKLLASGESLAGLEVGGLPSD